ncbi:hypothetical protein TBR22_A27630 [Luteitalea sp. TBR-22]|uniref:flagellar hook-length control protein FliK n=1 Tax=Luteitalea sp. TBR-22 TaxID=2802971 RepID=UPI001AF32FA0|nr:flagellar hook-length control protein FliK [Luteitalea sp. TBR-22]BCS33536.1 hypothetical protein TBR22_A27630 [Luteitalea sp. TBR-22]
MSLVPFAPSTAAAVPSAVSRPAGSPASPRAGGPPAASPRSQAVARGGVTATHQAKGRQGFASVLAAVQDQEPQEAADRSPSSIASPETRATTGAPGPSSHEAAESEDEAVPGNDLRTASPGDPQTPWLLLALGAGPWAEVVAPSADGAHVGAEDGGGDAVILALDERLATSPAEPPAAPGSQLVVAAPLAGEAFVVGAPAGNPVASSSAPVIENGRLQEPPTAMPTGPLAAAMARTPNATGQASADLETSATPSGEATLGGSPDTAQAGVPVQAERASVGATPADATSTDPPAVHAPAADIRARSSVASGGGDRSAPTTAGEGTDRVPGGGQVAPGATANRLAQALGRAVGAQTDAPGAAVHLVPVEASATPPSMSPSASRATEVLLRLAQGGGPVSRRATESAASGAFAQMLSSALPTSATTPVGAAPPPSAPLPVATGEQVLAQVVASLKVQWKDGIGEAKLHLRPDALGHVSVALKVEAGAVTAVVKADNPQVQEWILQHQSSLRQQMEAAGLRLDDLVVSPDDQRQSGGQSQPDGEEAPHRQPRRDRDQARGDGARFEMLL